MPRACRTSSCSLPHTLHTSTPALQVIDGWCNQPVICALNDVESVQDIVARVGSGRRTARGGYGPSERAGEHEGVDSGDSDGLPGDALSCLPRILQYVRSHNGEWVEFEPPSYKEVASGVGAGALAAVGDAGGTLGGASAAIDTS
eukprot:364358-Chlamydomonas_euryale.AAC.25